MRKVRKVLSCCKSKAVKDIYVPVFTPGSEPIAKVEHCQYLASNIKSLHVRGNMPIKKFPYVHSQSETNYLKIIVLHQITVSYGGISSQ